MGARNWWRSTTCRTTWKVSSAPSIGLMQPAHQDLQQLQQELEALKAGQQAALTLVEFSDFQQCL